MVGMGSYLQRSSIVAVGAGQTPRRLRLEDKPRRHAWILATAGNAITEFALIVPLFFLMVFASVDMARLFYVEATLQNAVRQGGRYASTGNHQPDPQHSGQNLSRVNSIILVAQQAAMGLNVSNIQISSLAGGAGSAGGPGDTVTLSLTSNVTLLTPIVGHFFTNGTYTFTVSVSFKNESFPPNLTS